MSLLTFTQENHHPTFLLDWSHCWDWKQLGCLDLKQLWVKTSLTSWSLPLLPLTQSSSQNCFGLSSLSNHYSSNWEQSWRRQQLWSPSSKSSHWGILDARHTVVLSHMLDKRCIGLSTVYNYLGRMISLSLYYAIVFVDHWYINCSRTLADNHSMNWNWYLLTKKAQCHLQRQHSSYFTESSLWMFQSSSYHSKSI